jgi:demethylmenaquinone methyltransferase/2-methoxy-6-polyprenyl-1,4-benzoquinol methylase
MKEEGKARQQVRSMFNSIAPKYDFLNHFLSLGIDYSWRKKVIRLLSEYHPRKILDVATGTADLAIAAVKLDPDEIIGIDLAEEMLEIGRKKILIKGLDHLIRLEPGDSENLEFSDERFDAVMVAFGVRNFEHLDTGLSEMYRVLNKGGIVAILEFSKPSGFPVKQLYYFYFRHILPWVGRIVSGNNSAYTYLPESVINFPSGNQFLQCMSDAGFRENSHRTLTFGIATLYSGYKK